MENKIVTDLYIKNIETGKETVLTIFDSMNFNNIERKLVIYSYGYRTTIRNIEKYEFKIKYRIIDNEEEIMIEEKEDPKNETNN